MTMGSSLKGFSLAARPFRAGHQVHGGSALDQEPSATGPGLTMAGATARRSGADACLRLGWTALACRRHPFDCVKLASWPAAGETPGAGACPESTMAPTGGTDCGSIQHRFGGDGRHPEGLRARGGEAAACFQWRPFRAGRHPDPGICGRAHMVAAGGPAGLLLNLQRAGPPAGEIGRCAGAGRRCVALHRPIRKRLDPRGRTYYWLAGEVVFDLESGTAGPAAGHRCGPRSMPVVPPSPPCSPNVLAGKRG